MRLFALLVVIPSLVLSSAALRRFENDKNDFEREFGRPIRQSPLLYHVNQNYVLEVASGSGGEVHRVSVYPKHYLEGLFPEWTEPTDTAQLSLEDFRKTLSRINRARKIGTLINDAKMGVVTNTTLWLADRYEKAYVEKGLYRTFVDSKTAITTVRSFDVYYIRQIKGIVEGKSSPTRRTDGVSKLKVNGYWYFADQDTARRARIGRMTTAKLAGPIDSSKQKR